MRSKDRLDELRQLARVAGVYHDTVLPAEPRAHSKDIDELLREVEPVRAWILDVDRNTQLMRRLLADPVYHSDPPALSLSDEECEQLLDNDNIALFVDNLRAETAEARLALREAEARRDELARVERSLQSVRDLFLQLAHLVAAQQEQLDSVEYYALQASEHVESGGNELLKGTVSRRKTRKKQLGLIVCLASGALIVLLVLVWS